MKPSLSVGVSLIELVIVIVILSAGFTALIATIVNTTQHSADPQVQQQAYAVAQAYMEEILSQPFCDPNDFSTDCFADCGVSACGTCTGSTVPGGGAEARASFDDVCDYEPINEAASDINGAIAALSDYTVVVTIDDTGVNFNGLLSNSGQVVQVDVDVTHTSGFSTSLTSFKANF